MPPHVIEDAGVDIYRVFDTYGCVYTFYDSCARDICSDSLTELQGVDIAWPHRYLAKKPSTYEEWLARADLSKFKN